MALAEKFPMLRNISLLAHCIQKVGQGAVEFLDVIRRTDVRQEMSMLAQQMQSSDPTMARRLRKAAAEGWME